jgi:hypothetical protein
MVGNAEEEEEEEEEEKELTPRTELLDMSQ